MIQSKLIFELAIFDTKTIKSELSLYTFMTHFPQHGRSWKKITSKCTIHRDLSRFIVNDNFFQNLLKWIVRPKMLPFTHSQANPNVYNVFLLWICGEQFL